MITCRFVGGDSSIIGEREFDEVGQKATFSEVGFSEALLGGAEFIPEDHFNKLSFTDDELTNFGPIGVRMYPTQEFCEKLARAQQLAKEIRERLIANPEEISSFATN